MTHTFTICLWQNFGAAIDMLINAVRLCPNELWNKQTRFYYTTYHTVIFLDYYLSSPVTDFIPVLPYTLTDEPLLPVDAVDDVLPTSHYSREEIVNYLTVIREKCRTLILNATEEKLASRWIADEDIHKHGLCPSIVEHYTLLEILFYNFRHVQHHVAQLNSILRQEINQAPEWVAMVE